MERQADVKVRMLMIGGFLGAGKTTLITKMAKDLRVSGVGVGVIMNDQADSLVDTQYSEALGLSSCEVAGGCFCCRFPDLMDRAEGLIKGSRPQMIIAEPVGSCTDLMATVVHPLKKLYSDRFQVAPLIIMVDAEQATKEGFDRTTLNGYLRGHQLEEAEVVVLSKSDLVPRAEIERLMVTVSEANPQAMVIVHSATTGEGYDKVLELVTSDAVSLRDPKEIDYARYAEAEAELGWYNATLTMDLDEGTDTYAIGMGLLESISSQYPAGDVAHAKILLTTPQTTVKMSCVRGRVSVDTVRGQRFASGHGRLTINARVVSEPQRLRESVRAALRQVFPRNGFQLEREDSFTPSAPKPFHRMKG